MIDFTVPDGVAHLADRVARFVEETVIPAERLEPGEHGPTDATRRLLQAAGRAEGLLAPHVGASWGGLGLDLRGQAVVFEAAGHSPLGPIALNCAAPDEGTMHLLEVVATPAQQERWLAPLAAGEIRSCFAMTEPSPGAGSDPAALRTTARPVPGGWVIEGRKWYITGADGAAFAVVMAMTDVGATMLLVDAANPGMRVERLVGSLDRNFVGGHAEVVFDGCRVPADAVLGEVGAGFRYAQVRLAPARLTHCMRWLGLASRAQQIALDRVRARPAFGGPLADLGMVQGHLADSELDLAAARMLVWQACWAIDAGANGRHESSMAKAFTAEAVYRVIDRAVQLCGALGVSDDLPLASWLGDARAFRIYDGPTDVHRWAVARRALRRPALAPQPEPEPVR